MKIELADLADNRLGDLLAERAVAFPLNVIEDLVKGRLLREGIVGVGVVQYILGQPVAEAGLEEEDP